MKIKPCWQTKSTFRFKWCYAMLQENIYYKSTGAKYKTAFAEEALSFFFAGFYWLRSGKRNDATCYGGVDACRRRMRLLISLLKGGAVRPSSHRWSRWNRCRAPCSSSSRVSHCTGGHNPPQKDYLANNCSEERIFTITSYTWTSWLFTYKQSSGAIWVHYLAPWHRHSKWGDGNRTAYFPVSWRPVRTFSGSPVQQHLSLWPQQHN